MDIKVVQQLAGKLGLLEEQTILDKTTELLRLLQMKGTSMPQIGDYAKCVICLDLSTSLHGHEFDVQTALKLSGLKKPSYLNNRRIIEKLLDLSKPMGVTEICIQLNLTEVQSGSQKILDQFVSSSGFRNIDTTHPQYAAMAVYQLCRMKKIKVQKSKFVSFSHLKPSQWSILEKSWDTWAKNNTEMLKEFQKPTKKSSKATSLDEPRITESEENLKTKSTATVIVTEDYDVWRERILKKAFEDLERLKG